MVTPLRRLEKPATVVKLAGAPAELVTEFPRFTEFTAVVVTPSSAALVLGSTQPIAGIDEVSADAAGLPRIRRRSGGGGVIVRPGGQLWIDLFVPSSHPLAHHDVSQAALVVGRFWEAALAPLLREELTVYDGALQETRWSRINCFSGVGPGEVLLAGRKLVGVSQRRDRAGIWFFSMAHLRFDPDEQASVAAIDAEERAELRRHLVDHVATLPISPTIAERALIDEFGSVSR